MLEAHRGGGELGLSWRNAARGMNRHRTRDDLLAVADALIANGVTAPDHLLGRTASAGGLAFGMSLCRIVHTDTRA